MTRPWVVIGWFVPFVGYNRRIQDNSTTRGTPSARDCTHGVVKRGDVAEAVGAARFIE